MNPPRWWTPELKAFDRTYEGLKLPYAGEPKDEVPLPPLTVPMRV